MTIIVSLHQRYITEISGLESDLTSTQLMTKESVPSGLAPWTPPARSDDNALSLTVSKEQL